MTREIWYDGVAASPGIAIAEAVTHEAGDLDVEARPHQLVGQGVAREVALVERVQGELEGPLDLGVGQPVVPAQVVARAPALGLHPLQQRRAGVQLDAAEVRGVGVTRMRSHRHLKAQRLLDGRAHGPGVAGVAPASDIDGGERGH